MGHRTTKNSKLLHLTANLLIGVAALCLSGLTAGQTSTAPDDLRPIQREMMLGPGDRSDVLETTKEIHPFTQLLARYGNEPLVMTGLRPKIYVDFQVPRDEIATYATVFLKWTASPSLIPVRSQVNIRLNGEMQVSLPINTENLGRPAVNEIKLDAKKLKNRNTLEFDFVGSYTNSCESLAHKTLWVEIDKDSSITLAKQKVRLADELILLPSPFIDEASHKRIVLPFVFAGTPNDDTLKAAAIVASWAGVQADWRGLSIPVYYDLPPADSHFVVFATADTLPEFLKESDPIEGPEIRIADEPNSGWAKMLIVLGRNDAELITAARALALHSDTLAGRRALIKEPVITTERKAYDAPKWLSTDRKVPFSELQQYGGQLQSSGALPPPIRLNFRLPPDLFIVPRTYVPLDLQYRYTPPPEDAPASVRIRINGSLMHIHELAPDRSTNRHGTQHLPALDSMASWIRALNIPAVYLDAANELEFDFQYSLAVSGGATLEKCPSLLIPDNQVDIVPNSTLDFRGFYHFARMPNTRLFAQSGYPFTRFADFAQTVAVVPSNIEAVDASMFLTTMGRTGAQTGAAATLITVSSNPNPEILMNKDILVFGRIPDQTKPDDTPPLFEQEIVSVLSPADNNLPREQRQVKARPELTTTDKRAAIVGFESPISTGRSVVAILSAKGDGTRVLHDKLSYPSSLTDAEGAVSLVAGRSSVNFYTADSYYIGNLPWWQRIWYALLDRPLVLFFLSAIFIVASLTFIYVTMKRVAAKRLKDAHEALQKRAGRRKNNGVQS